MREHTIQIDKTLAAIGRAPSEPERLARLLHRALGECEASTIGAPDAAADQRQAVATTIAGLAREMASLRA